ncbi:hypothetical protein O181_027224 [Austropuccinia psidii MF-1]|uniref:Man1/Src1-like C-terminal domain-containing protein n=1 Tax=Austropuccinia psidii MF-1 TaxID=1389203 RepID=A0A9Q3H2E4_9BASI|nr:hypothetical protein [Austropuccinia psidii MF-1]
MSLGARHPWARLCLKAIQIFRVLRACPLPELAFSPVLIFSSLVLAWLLFAFLLKYQFLSSSSSTKAKMSKNPQPPPDWMLPDFDPQNSKVSELRSILLENNIPHSYTKKSDLINLFEKQVKPMTPKLLRDHQNVVPSAKGIIDMSTGHQYKPSKLKSPTKNSNSSAPIENHQLNSFINKSKRQINSTSRRDSILQSNIDSDRKSTPDVPRSTRSVGSARRKSAKPASTPQPSSRLGKRKVEEQINSEDEGSQSDHVNDANPFNQRSTAQSTQISQAPQTSTPIPVKRRKSEFPTQSSTSSAITSTQQDDSSISSIKLSRPKNRRTTMHEAIEANDSNFSDFNPFQIGSEDEKSGGSSRKPRKSKRQSSVPRPSILPSSVAKSNVSPRLSNIDSPNQVNPTPQANHPQTPYASASYLSNSHAQSIHTPAPVSTRKSSNFPTLPSNKRLNMPHLHNDYELNSSPEQGTPDHIYRLLVGRDINNQLDQSKDTRQRSPERSPEHAILQDEDSKSSIKFLGSSPQLTRRSQDHNSPSESRPSGSFQSRPPMHLPPRTPYRQPPNQSSSNLHQTPFPRPQVQRIRLDELVHTPADKKLKINRSVRVPASKRTGLLLFSPTQGLSFLLKLGCLGIIFAVLNWYREQTGRYGYCDTGMASNAMTRDRRIDQFLEFEEEPPEIDPGLFSGLPFRARIAQLVEAGTAIGLLPDCHTCPAHAICDRGKIVRCETDFVEKHTDWEKQVHSWLPTVMGPKCVPDTAKLIKIVEIANRVNRILKKRRGTVLCGMGMRATEEEKVKGVKVKLYGMEEKELKEDILKGEEDEEGINLMNLEEEIFELAIQELEKSQEIIRIDGWLSTSQFKFMELSWKCKLKLGVLKLIKKFKLILISIGIGLFGWIYIKIKLNNMSEEKKRVAELVEITLTKLRDESWTHHTNPSLAPNPMIASAQLRDLILSYDHSPVNRQKLWRKVEKVIEGNSNVRTKLSEIRGENIKVWEWIGSYKGDFSINNNNNNNNNFNTYHSNSSPHT